MTLSAGTLLFKSEAGCLKVLIAHMGGPFWARKDERGWSIPKGEYEEGDDPQEVAAREFKEEMGRCLPEGSLIQLGTVKQPSGKKITAFALEADFDADQINSNTFEMEWPKGSGSIKEFPEIDRAGWFDYPTASKKLVKGQVPFLDKLVAYLSETARDGFALNSEAGAKEGEEVLDTLF